MAAREPKGLDRCDDLDFNNRVRFAAVIAKEYGEIDRRREAAKQKAEPSKTARPRKLRGLALSGGGVRSATFNLGLLQGLAESDKLQTFDYLSTVSGGGYTGGWWSAWLSRDERKDDPPGVVFPPPEDIESERDERRAQMEASPDVEAERQQIKDSAINAGTDPIHHLRLFSNVLTPRKGLLSGDTWRAVAVVLRNIVLTWLILLPILLVAIMIGQSVFELAGVGDDLLKRLGFALIVPALLFIGNVVAVAFWMLFSRRLRTMADKIVVAVSTIVFFTLTARFGIALDVSVPKMVWLVILAWIVYIVLRLLFWKFAHRATMADADYWRNRLVVIHTRTLAYAVFALAIFLFAGFGAIFFDFLLTIGQKQLADRVAQAGGWGGFALAALSAIYTALKTAPTGGGDPKSTAKPSLMQRVIFAVAPILLILALGIVLSWVGDTLYRAIYPDHDRLLIVAGGALVSAFLFLVFALYEFRPRPRWKSLVVVVLWLIVVAAAFRLDPRAIEGYLRDIAIATLALLTVVLIIRAVVRKRLWIAGFAAALAAAAFGLYRLKGIGYIFHHDRIPQLVVGGIVATLVLLLFELLQGRGANTRSIALAVIACTIFVLVGAAASGGEELGYRALTLVSLIATVLGWILALGWLSDPNSLTLHGFYKARLVRAYMGASNARRGEAKDVDITDSVPGDDLLLTQLRNTERGAPYHLINTMLNLVGGSDLSTQARASDSFLMSKHFCGSMRTGYRPTSEYSCGSISLGTAVAVSGAAASPTMGAQTPSAALSALMTLFNVRTGYWAPTPSLSYWRSGSARLWPVYTLQEFVSQTTDLLPYCYLTDGGHYENTGVYSLIQRGCNVIVVGECGADPETTLDDLGNMMRKVRIDFGTEIELDIAQLRTRPPGTHVVVGKIVYGADYAAAIGLPDDERTGTIVVVKPNLAGGEPVDVQQYGFLHSDFPQQQTFDLWYDEAQFESYRRLGEESGRLAVKTGVI